MSGIPYNMQANKRNAQMKKKSTAPKRGNGGGGKPMIAPVAVANAQRFPANSRRMQSHRFTGSELVASVIGSVAFAATKYAVNPGLAASFPRLSVEASKWEQYCFRKLRYRFVTRTSTSTVGSVILSPEYAVNDPAPASEVQATDTQDAVEDAVWKEVSCDLDVKAMYPSGPRKLIRHGAVPGDLNLYDSANFYVCTVEEAGTDAIGKLWVDYDVELFVPQNSSLTAPKSSMVSYAFDSTGQTFTTAVPALVDMDAFTEDPLGIGSDSSGTYTPPNGMYEVSYCATFRDSSAENFEVILEVLKNGAVLSPRAQQANNWTATASGSMETSVRAFVSCSGTDTVAIQVTATGAAGTLSTIANRSLLYFRAI